MSMRAIVIRGPFSAENFAQLVATLREIDGRAPEGSHFEIVAVDPDETALDVSKKLLAQALPAMKGRETRWDAYPQDRERWAEALGRAIAKQAEGYSWRRPDELAIDGANFQLPQLVRDLFAELAKPDP